MLTAKWHNKVASSVVGITATLGLLATGYGLKHMPGFGNLSWLGFALGATVLLALARRITGLSTTVLAAGSVLALTLAAGKFSALSAVLCLGASALTLGHFLLVQRLGLLSTERSILLLLGAGLYASVVGILARWEVAYTWSYGALLLLPLWLVRSRVSALPDATQRWWHQQVLTGPEKALSVTSVQESAIAALLLIYVGTAYLPDVGADSLAMHLMIPAQLAEFHRWGFDFKSYVWAVMPMLGDWMYALVVMFGGEAAARLLNASFIGVLGLLIVALVRWAGGTAGAARWALLLHLSTPLTFTESSVLFIESIWTSYVVAALLLVLRACSAAPQAGKQLAVASALLGLALAAKAVTLPMVPVLLLLLALSHRQWASKQVFAQWGLGFAVLLVLGCVPYVNAWRLTGNPVFPFFNHLFKSPFSSPTNFDASAFGKGMPWDLAYQVTFDSGRFLEAHAGAGGFQWLLLLLPLVAGFVLARQVRPLALVLFGLLATALVFRSTAYLRYVFPAYVVLAAAIGTGLGANAPWGRWWRGWLAGLAVLAVLLNLWKFSAGSPFGSLHWQAMVSTQAREAFVNSVKPVRRAVQVVNELNVKRTPVAVLSEPAIAGLQAQALLPTWYNWSWQMAYFGALTPTALSQLLHDSGVEYIIVDEHWNGSGNVPAWQVGLLAQVSTEIWQLGPIKVRRVGNRLADGPAGTNELLGSSDFSDIRKWRLSAGARHIPESNTVLVTLAAPAHQDVHVQAGNTYHYSLQSRCHATPEKVRLQVGWRDVWGQLLRLDVDIVDCTATWSEHRAKWVAPERAATATVYGMSQGQGQIEVRSVSLKR